VRDPNGTTIMPILTYEHPMLWTKLPKNTAPVAHGWLDCMWRTMYANKGIGLAANQIGWKRRVFIMKVPGGVERVFINPEITQSSGAYVAEEGCLSFPGRFIEVERATRVEVTCHNRDMTYTIPLLGLEARVAQHEIDHLDGIVFEQRI